MHSQIHALKTQVRWDISNLLMQLVFRWKFRPQKHITGLWLNIWIAKAIFTFTAKSSTWTQVTDVEVIHFFPARVLQWFFKEPIPYGTIYDPLRTRFGSNWKDYDWPPFKTRLQLSDSQMGTWPVDSAWLSCRKSGDVWNLTKLIKILHWINLRISGQIFYMKYNITLVLWNVQSK